MRTYDPAFPAGPDVSQGLTKREYLAAVVMAGTLASCTGDSWPKPEDIAKRAVLFADALIDELNKPKQ